jgi:hypothetical protein
MQDALSNQTKLSTPFFSHGEDKNEEGAHDGPKDKAEQSRSQVPDASLIDGSSKS